MKLLIGLLLVVVIVLSLSVAYQKNQIALVGKKQLEYEVYNKLLAEEKLNKANLKIAELESIVLKSETQLKNSKRLLDQTVKLNEDLKMRLEKTSSTQKELQDKIEAMEKLSTQNNAVQTVVN